MLYDELKAVKAALDQVLPILRNYPSDAKQI